MKSFKQFFTEEILTESVDYKYPIGEGAAPFVMADFYVLSYMKSYDKGSIDAGSNHYKPSVVRSLEQSDDIEYAEKQLLPRLKEELLKDVFFALSAEVRHVFSHTNLNEDQFRENKFLVQYKRTHDSYKSSGVFSDPRKPRDRKEYKQNNRGYQDSYAAIKTVMKKYDYSRGEVVKEMYKIFTDYSWSSSYGGPAWAGIAKGWSRLYNAKRKDELYVAIDHVYDLQHNTDTVFNKLKKYYIGGGYNWIAEALDFKANIRSFQELIPRMSGSMKKIARPFLLAVGDGPKEDEITEKPKEQKPTSKKQEIDITNLLGDEVYRGPSKVDDNLDLYGTPITSLGNLESVGGYMTLSKTPIKSLGNLQSVGGSLDLKYTPITSLGNLETVGGSLYLKYTPITSLGNLQSVRGSMTLSNTPIKSLGNLQSVGSNLYLSNTPKLTDLGKLKEVKGKVYYTKGTKIEELLKERGLI